MTEHKNENYYEVVLSTLRPKNDRNNNCHTVEWLMNNSGQRELLRQVKEVNTVKTDKLKTSLFLKARPKSKYQCSTSSGKVKQDRKRESEDIKMYQKK